MHLGLNFIRSHSEQEKNKKKYPLLSNAIPFIRIDGNGRGKPNKASALFITSIWVWL